jgi:homoserine kinase type II
MALYTVLPPAELAAVAARFGLPPPDRAEPEPRGRVNTSYHLWAGGQRWFLRVAEGKTEADVRFEAAVHAALAEARFPAPRLRPAADGRPFAPAAGKPAMLFGYAPGELREAAEAGPALCRRVGEQLGRLHDLSGGLLPERPNPYGPACVAGWLEGLSAGPGEAELAEALPVLREEGRAAAALPGAPRGLVHGDLFPDNVLWVGDRIAAVLDWEMSCTEAFAWDLAVAVDAWCYTDRHRPERARALLDGYRSRRALEPETAAALHAFARFQALRFALGRIRTFLRAAPHAGAAPAEGQVVWKDWRRSRDRLLALRAMGPDGYRALLGIDG